VEELEGKIDICKIGKVLNGLDSSTDPKEASNNKNISLNSSPVLSKDASTITFTFKRSGTAWNEDNDSRYFEKTIVQRADSVILRKIILSPDKKKNRYEATIATSVDGQIVLTYRDEDGSASLYTSCLDGNHWTLPEKLNGSINLAGWEPNEYVSADGTTMYFISDRKGGYGGKDIYVCKKMENGEWSKAVNMGPAINTPYDEEAPFIHPDGKTFYFSSNGFNKEGNYEILGCQLSRHIIPTGISKIGFPIDTTNNTREVARTKRSVEEQHVSKKRHKNTVEQVDNKTNYFISFSNPNGIPLTLVKGSIIDRSGLYNGSLVIEIKDNSSEKVTASYLTELSDQEFAFILPPSMNNNISFQKKGFFIQSMNLNTSDNKDHYKRLDPVVLLPIEKDARIVLKNVFFETGSSAISMVSKAELNDRVNFMKENPEVSFEILGVAECGSNIRENSKLCSARADELVRYFIDKGIEKDRLNAKGYALRLKGAAPETFDQRIELRIIEEEVPKNKSLTTKEKIGKGK
jgi:outer membrane protein OmpA-like peptidoglycan-associated protein